MPRSSGASTKRSGANQHNTRHENGLAAPGKRISSKRSNGNLNGHTNGKLLSSAPPEPPRSATRITLQSSSDNSSNGSLSDSKNGMAGKMHVNGNGRRYSDDSSDGPIPYQNGTSACPGGTTESHRRIDVNASKTPGVHNSSAMSLPATVLASAPLADTIALLIILLQIPPTFLTIIHFLFAALTFISPTTGSSFPSFADFFQGSNGVPSLSTVLLADVVFGAFSVLLWPSAREYVFDLAQAVIALSLGGGYSGGNGNGNGGAKNAVICAGIIFASQLVRKGSRPNGPGFGGSDGTSGMTRSSSSLPDFNSLKTTRGWIRSVIAVHILAQGIVRAVRRWLSRREQGVQVLATRADPEAAAGSQVQSDNAGHHDINSNGPTICLTDALSGKDRGSGGKKKKRQGNLVRSQQPLWAALASTKVIVMKEMEQSQTMAEAAGSKATDINNLGNAPFTSEEGRVWITNIGPSEISFGTSFFFATKASSASVESKNSSANGPAGVDRTKPFYVRVNRANWTSTRIYKASDDKSHVGEADWIGEIFGLTPMSSYECEFVRSEDDIVVYATNVTTLAESTAEPLPSPINHQSLRPSSPTTTLKNSIAAAEAKLNEEKARLKRAKKDHKSHIANLKKEVENYGTRLANSGSGDERQRQRVLQITQHIRQAEDAAAAMCAEIDALGSIPEEDTLDWKRTRELWEAEKERLEAAHTEFNELNANLERQISSAQSDLAAVQQKSERLQARQAKLNEQHERIANAHAKGLSAKGRQAAEIALRDTERAATEQHYTEQILNLRRQIQDYTYRSQQVWGQVRSLEAAFLLQKQQQAQQQSQQQQLMTHSPSLSGENVATTMPSHSARTGFSGLFAFPSFGPQPIPVTHNVNPMLSSQQPSIFREGRGRSSSMLSHISGLTDFSDAEPMPADAAVNVDRERKRSVGNAGIEALAMSAKREHANSSPGVIGDSSNPWQQRAV